MRRPSLCLRPPMDFYPGMIHTILNYHKPMEFRMDAGYLSMPTTHPGLPVSIWLLLKQWRSLSCQTVLVTIHRPLPPKIPIMWLQEPVLAYRYPSRIWLSAIMPGIIKELWPLSRWRMTVEWILDSRSLCPGITMTWPIPAKAHQMAGHFSAAIILKKAVLCWRWKLPRTIRTLLPLSTGSWLSSILLMVTMKRWILPTCVIIMMSIRRWPLLKKWMVWKCSSPKIARVLYISYPVPNRLMAWMLIPRESILLEMESSLQNLRW